MVNSVALKKRAKELRIRQSDIARRLNLRQSTVNQKINNRRPMMLHEAEVIADMLSISDESFGFYFFAT